MKIIFKDKTLIKWSKMGRKAFKIAYSYKIKKSKKTAAIRNCNNSII